MIIIHKIDDSLFDLFPKANEFGKNNEKLIEEIQEFYTYGIYKPKVEIKDNLLYVHLDVIKTINEDKDFKKAVKFCENGNYKQAKPILEKLLSGNPTVSEYHRILGQIASEEGEQEIAINYLIDALKWDPKNIYAYIMTGNIYAKYFDDIDTSTKYYNKALEIKPDDFITINNIGGNFLNLQKYDEAERYLNLAHELKPDYPQTLAGLAQLNLFKPDLLSSFNYSILALKNSKYNDPVYNHISKQLFDVSNAYKQMNSGIKLFENYKHELEVGGAYPLI